MFRESEPRPATYFGKGALSLPTQNKKVISSFGSIAFADDRYYNPVAPIGALLTITPNFSDLRALDLVNTGGTVDLFYKIIYDGPAEEGEDLEGSLDVVESDADGYSPLSQRGMRVFVPFWAVSISVKAVGTGVGGSTWGTAANPLFVRFKTSLTPLAGRPGQGNNSLPARLGSPNDYLPRYSNRVKVDKPFGLVGASFNFIDLAEVSIVSYDVGDEVAIPPNAVKIGTATPPLWAHYTLF